MLAESGPKPLEADQASVLSAGGTLALAIVLLFYMIRLRRKDVLPRPEASSPSRDWADELSHTGHDIGVQARRGAEQALQEKKDLSGPMWWVVSLAAARESTVPATLRDDAVRGPQ